MRILEFPKHRHKRLCEEYVSETRRGSEEAPVAIATLRALWPAAFPREDERIKPLIHGILQKIQAATGWSRGYTRGVVRAWKSRAGYYEALLRCKQRYDLSGTETAQRVDAAARARARQRLALLGILSRAATSENRAGGGKQINQSSIR